MGLLVVLIGAYTRLADAGLGCPDWPGCYGFLTVPDTPTDIASVNERYPNAQVETDKAWIEMIHRYLATLLGAVIVAILGFAIWSKQSLAFPITLLAVVIVQGAFGAWTVTLKLWPQIVTLHLLGGFTTVAILWLYLQRLGAVPNLRGISKQARQSAKIVLVMLVIQITLGGWTSANYAALACPDFPLCHGELVPNLDLNNGFNIFQTIGPNYLGGELSNDARIAIQLTHRLGALILVGLTVWLLFQLTTSARWLVSGILAVQFALGVSNVLMNLPLSVAVAHNFVAMLLLLAILSIVNSRSTRSSAG